MSNVKKRLIPTLVAPKGLTITSLIDGAAVTSETIDEALQQANSVFDGECECQIASNQHFFINLPFPLTLLTRTADTPTFKIEDERVSKIVALFRAAMHKFSIPKAQQNELITHANIIVRQYKPGWNYLLSSFICCSIAFERQLIFQFC
jgi:hypothetical protein